MFLLPSLPISNRARCYVSRSMAKELSDIANKSLQRCNFFSTTQIHRSSLQPGQRIETNPGSGRPSKKSSPKDKKEDKLYSDRPFVDRIHLKTRGGSGGTGCISYHYLGAFKKRPCGGHGGKGGDVILVTDPTLSSLKMEKNHYFGQDGGRGGSNAMQGKRGKDMYVRVPCGVVVRRVLEWEEIEEIYAQENKEEVEETAELDDTEDANVFNIANDNETLSNNDDDGRHVEMASSQELDDDAVADDAEEGIDVEQGEPSDEEEEEDEGEAFDTEYKNMLLSKRGRKRARKPRGAPSDYDDVVDQEVRADDGMYHWSNPESNDDNMHVEDNDAMKMASTAYPNFDETSNPTRKTAFMADLDKPNQSLLVAQGGKEGVGNLAYAGRPYFSNLHANAAKKSKSESGEITYLELELKLIADVGLVGFPNAGKSSLLSAMSNSRPKIASYPFTTLHPLVGSIQYKDGYNIIMADVPGLIDGAAEGRGRGIEFLRHIERTKALVYIVDVAGVDGRDPIHDLKILGNELREYGSSGIFGENEMGGDEGEYGEEMRRRRRDIMKRPSLILANKMDLISHTDAKMGRKEELLVQLGKAAEEVGIVCENHDILGISAGVTGEGLRGLSKRLRQVVKEVG